MTPARGTLLVRKLETEETISGGKIVLPDAVRENMTPNQAEVVSVGWPTECDDEDCPRDHGLTIEMATGREYPSHDHQLAPRQWVILAPRSLVATHEDGLYSVSQDAVLAIVQP